MRLVYSNKFRKALNLSSDQYLLHVADIISSPNREQFFQPSDELHFPHLHASRALPIAQPEDVVILSGPLNKPYYMWLRSCGLSTDNVYSYALESTRNSLAEIITEDPEPVKAMLTSLPGKAVYLPFYASQQDMKVADCVLDVDFYGCNEEIVSQYFDKLTFKNICLDLGIEMIEGQSHEINDNCRLNLAELEHRVQVLLHTYEKLIIRGSVGSAGRSLFTVDSENIKETYQQLLLNNDKQILIEPLLSVISSPNDQWVVDLQGDMHHLSLTAQLFQGLKHAGNLSGQYYSKRIQQEIFRISSKIVKQMAKVGYRGVLGIDYIVSNDGIYPIENNARVNGSTYVHALVEQLEQKFGKIACWKFYKAQTQACSFKDLQEQLTDLIYDGKRINSVFPFDCDLLEQKGELTIIIFAEDLYHIDYIQDLLLQKSFIGR
jgi:hypothetical protein